MSEHEQNPGSAMPDEQLEARLAGLTEWTGSTAGPLARALAATGQEELKPGVLTRLRGLAAGWGAAWGAGSRGLSGGQIAAVLAVGAVGVIVAGMVLPGDRRASVALERAPSVLASVAPSSPAKRASGESAVGAEGWGEWKVADNSDAYYSWRYDSGGAAVPELDLQASFQYKHGGGGESPVGESKARGISEQGQSQQTSAGRQIIRRGQVELVAADVQVAFRKAQDLIKAERGEFVQDSVLSGSGQAMTARVVLRVDPSRLAEVMQASRGLGELAAEQTGGDDVTERLTDLDAQIRNEQRVEKEMLELFDLRKDAPLKDVLELREQLARVRGNIERMQAQRSQTERLVSLATLAITIRPQPDKTVAPPPVNETPSFGARVSQEVSRAWDRGTTNLAGSAGWLVETVIGKAPVWGTLAVTGVVIWRIVRRRKPKEDSPQSR